MIAFNMVVTPQTRKNLGGLKLDTASLWPTVHLPVLVTQGDKDKLVLPAMAEYTAQTYPVQSFRSIQGRVTAHSGNSPRATTGSWPSSSNRCSRSCCSSDSTGSVEQGVQNRTGPAYAVVIGDTAAGMLTRDDIRRFCYGRAGLTEEGSR